jgi:uncharacterized protein YcfJ
MRQSKTLALALTTVLLVEGCATAPLGPTVYVTKGPNKTFDQFQEDAATCKQYASQEVQGQADQANNQAVGSAVIGALAGAALGAAIGGGGRGAAIGAASGGALGTAVGANQSQWASMGIQQRYNSVYLQCMSAKGNQVPVYTAPPPAYYYPYPAPGYYPPPPPPPPPPGY